MGQSPMQLFSRLGPAPSLLYDHDIATTAKNQKITQSYKTLPFMDRLTNGGTDWWTQLNLQDPAAEPVI